MEVDAFKISLEATTFCVFEMYCVVGNDHRDDTSACISRRR